VADEPRENILSSCAISPMGLGLPGTRLQTRQVTGTEVGLELYQKIKAIHTCCSESPYLSAPRKLTQDTNSMASLAYSSRAVAISSRQAKANQCRWVAKSALFCS
jgi:hypothetical protein